MTADTLYAGLVACRNTEGLLRWSQSQLFTIIHAAGLSATITQGRALGAVLVIVIGLLGLSLTFLWVLVVRRANQAVDYWHRQLIALEMPRPDIPAPAVRVFGGDEWDRFQKVRYVRFGRLLYVLVGFFALAWVLVILLVFFL